MAATPDTTAPVRFVIGTEVSWIVDLPDYPPSDGGTLVVYFGSTGVEKSAAGADYGDGRWVVTITAASSATFTAGTYSWQALRTVDAVPYLVGEGTIEAVGAIAGSGGIDLRSPARKNLAALEAVIANRATEKDLSHTIAGRSVSKFSHAELIEARRYWRNEVAKEDRAAAIKAGRAGQLVRGRFVW